MTAASSNATLFCGDCREVLKTIEANSVDSVVTDPPYELGFMGKSWDASGIAYDVEMWKQVFRVVKPGGHLLSFGGSRTYHRMACAIEDAGFEIRDQIMWLYGSGFPKSHNLEGEWEGWGTALKPAHEPIVIARKPLIGTVAANVRTHGTGALNIDACWVETDEALRAGSGGLFSHVRDGKPYPNTRQGEASAELRYTGSGGTDFAMKPGPRGGSPGGRWPANVIHDGSEEVVAGFPQTESGKPCGVKAGNNKVFGQFAGGIPVTGYGDKGSAARFFYCAKASKADRDDGLDRFEEKSAGVKNESGRGFSQGDPYKEIKRKNSHPTVKPTVLMRHLCRLVTPPGGTVLDPFMGSGSTGKAALKEGFRFIGIEREPEYFAIANARISPNQERPEMIIPMPKPEPEREPDLFSFTAA